MTFIQDNRNSSTLTVDSRSANATFTQDSRTKFSSAGKILGAFLHPIFMKSSLAKNLFIIDTRH